MNPDTNFFTALFNIDQSEIDSLVTRTDAETVVYELQLKRKELSCPYCGGPMIGHGHKLKKIDNPVLRNRKDIPHRVHVVLKNIFPAHGIKKTHF